MKKCFPNKSASKHAGPLTYSNIEPDLNSKEQT